VKGITKGIVVVEGSPMGIIPISSPGSLKSPSIFQSI
jgi:hypothetical protein